MTPDAKWCGKCSQWLPLAAFAKKARNKDGLQDHCRACWRAYLDTWRLKNGEKKAAYDRARAAADPVANRRRVAEWKAANMPRLLEERRAAKAIRDAEKAARDAEREARRDEIAQEKRDYSKAWAKANPTKRRAQHALRKATKLQATPPWADLKKIAEVYALAAEMQRLTGVPYHVDHFVPLRHPLVCGLHCEANLWPVPAVDNMRKGNRRWADMP